MNQPYTLRPREKLAASSAQKLTDNELLQALIGSGTKTVNVKLVARSLMKLFRQADGELTYAALLAVPGLGAAYASRIVAAFELTRRWQSLLPPSPAYVPMRDVMMIERGGAVATVLCDLYNGANELVDRLYIQIASSDRPASIVRTILVQTLPTQATAVHIGILGEHALRSGFFSDILLGTSLKATLSYIDVTLLRMSIVDKSGDVMEVIL